MIKKHIEVEAVLRLALEALIGDRVFLEVDTPVVIWSVNDKAVTAIKEALAQPEQEPLDTPIPCDVKVGHVTIRKGVALSVLVARMQVLYDMAQSAMAQPEQEPVAIDVGQLEYKGNSVGYIYQKMQAYRLAIDNAWSALRSKNIHPDGKTSLADMIANHTTPPQPKEPEQEPVAKDWRKEPWGFGEKRLVTVQENTTPPQRKPLTDEQIQSDSPWQWGWYLDSFKSGVRYAEAAHGIMSDTDGKE